MKEIKCVITDELGLHARPAGSLVKAANGYQCDIKVGRPDKMVDAKRIMGVMGLAMKHNDELILTFDGADEDVAASEMEAFIKANV